MSQWCYCFCYNQFLRNIGFNVEEWEYIAMRNSLIFHRDAQSNHLEETNKYC